MARRQDTRSHIIAAGRRLAADGGLGALTYDAVARRVGVTKQAVIYWFPTKEDLAREIIVPLLREEAEVAIGALAGKPDAREAVAGFVRALVAFHVADLTRFRLIYLAPQLSRRPEQLLSGEALDRHVHPVTGRMYGALEAVLARDPAFRADLTPRRAAAAVHVAALGLLTMVSLSEAIADPLAHGTDDLVDTLVALLTGGVEAQRVR